MEKCYANIRCFQQSGSQRITEHLEALDGDQKSLYVLIIKESDTCHLFGL